ncbi:MAG: hypothetical protein JWL87_113 [Candidatus Adlerbacteria bacterium]|nr:hypothetical protein [Candidatus Adlerbacteria bacterium]
MYVSVRVVAGAKKELVEELPKGRLKIWVKEPAERNLANHRVRELVAAHLNLPLADVRLLSGHTSPSKIFSAQS